MIWKPHSLGLAAILLMSGVSSAAADDQPLPGVKQPPPIVKDLEPEPDNPPATGGTFKVGNFDVRVSGSVTVDIGSGNTKPPRR